MILGNPFGYEEFWIEGKVGSTRGLVPFGHNWDFYNDLTCFTRLNGVVTYFNGFNTCFPPLGINDFS